MKSRPNRVRVLALHAATAGPPLWDEVQAEAPDLNLVVPDLHGLTRAVGGDAEALIRALASLVPTNRLVLVGCGVGANLAVHLAAAIGRRARSLLLLNPDPVSPHPRYREGLRSLAGQFEAAAGEEDLRVWLRLLLHAEGPRYRRAATLGAAMLRDLGTIGWAPLLRLAADLPDTLRALSGVQAPVRALFGETLNPFPGPNWIPAWKQAIGTAAVRVVPGSRDWLPLEIPERIATLLRRAVAAGNAATPGWRYCAHPDRCPFPPPLAAEAD